MYLDCFPFLSKKIPLRVSAENFRIQYPKILRPKPNEYVYQKSHIAVFFRLNLEEVDHGIAEKYNSDPVCGIPAPYGMLYTYYTAVHEQSGILKLNNIEEVDIYMNNLINTRYA